jgi:hypothetical protein
VGYPRVLTLAAYYELELTVIAAEQLNFSTPSQHKPTYMSFISVLQYTLVGEGSWVFGILCSENYFQIFFFIISWGD